MVVALVHLAAVASRFDVIAARIPSAAALAIMTAQFPLLVLSGYFEGMIDHGPPMAHAPRWMQIRSTPVRLAFTFGFIYVVCVALQTWDVSIGPVDPDPPESFPTAMRALWFAMFTVGMFFPFYLAAAKFLIPVLRAITWPLRFLPDAVGAILALTVGAGIGVVVLSAVTSTRVRQFIADIQAAIERDPALAVGVALVTALGPTLLGLVIARRARRA